MSSLKGLSSIPAAQAFGVDGSVESVLGWISCVQEEWLLVFDNADDPPPEQVAKFFPSGNGGNILITSRNKSMGRAISFENSIEINEMEEQDAIALLLSASCLDPLVDHHLRAAKKIVNALGCIPLAVDHAGAYIEAGKCEINNYLRQFSLHHQTLMSDATFKGASNYDQTVYGTWDLSFNEIEKRAIGQSITGNAEAAKAAIVILKLCAFYHHSNISKDIFQSAAKARKDVIDNEVVKKLPQAITSLALDHSLLALDNNGDWDDFMFGQGISVLLSFSLIKRGNLSEKFSIHPLMHCWSREKMVKSEQQRMCEMGSIILSCAIPLGFRSEDYAFRRLMFPHIKANQVYGTQIGLVKEYYDDQYSRFALVMVENGDWINAEPLQVHAMNMRKQILGPKHLDTLTSMANLASTYHFQGRWTKAEQLELQIMNERRRLLGIEHPDTLTSMTNLAKTYYRQKRWNKAELLDLQVIGIRKKLLGENYLDILKNMENLAATYWSQGRWDKAEQLDVQVMEIRKELLGVEHPDTLTSMASLATTYWGQGKWNEAEQLILQVIYMRKKLLGPEHPDTLKSVGNLAVAYQSQGRWDEAEKLDVIMIARKKVLLGAEHPDTLQSMENLAAIYQSQKRWIDAEKLHGQVMNIRKKLFGTEHPDTIISMENLAVIYWNQGRWNEAEQLDVQVLGIRRKLLGAEHPDTLTSMEGLAVTYQSQERLDEAEQLNVQVMDMRKKLLGAEHPDTLKIMGNLAVTYWSQGRWNEAEQLDIEVMKARKRLLGPEHPDTLKSMENLAITYQSQKRWNEAERLGVQVMKIRKKLLDTEHSDTLKNMGNLAITYQGHKRWNKVKQLDFGHKEEAVWASTSRLSQNHGKSSSYVSGLGKKEAEKLQF